MKITQNLQTRRNTYTRKSNKHKHTLDGKDELQQA